MTATTTPGQPAVSDLIALIRRADGGMRTTDSLAVALEIPETAVAPLAAQARALGLITTERDPRTLSPMHRLTDVGRTMTAASRTDVITSRARLASLARRPVSPAEIRVILSPAYLDWVLGNGPRPDTAR